MRKFLLLIPIFFVLKSCSTNNKENFSIGNLWQIESKSGGGSYIFGTIHLYSKNELELDDNVIAKLIECEVLATEMDMTDKSEQKKLMDVEMPAYFSETYKIMISEYGSELVEMENQLINIANDNGIKITGLESMDEILDVIRQLNAIEIPETELEKEKIINVYEQTLGMYKKEQIQTFKDSIKVLSEGKIAELVVDERNKNWLEDIVNLIEKNPTFIAVGMGHLGGEGGLLDLLSQKGYELTRIELNNESY